MPILFSRFLSFSYLNDYIAQKKVKILWKLYHKLFIMAILAGKVRYAYTHLMIISRIWYYEFLENKSMWIYNLSCFYSCVYLNWFNFTEWECLKNEMSNDKCSWHIIFYVHVMQIPSFYFHIMVLLYIMHYVFTCLQYYLKWHCI